MEEKKQDSSRAYPKLKPEDKQYKNQEEFIESEFPRTPDGDPGNKETNSQVDSTSKDISEVKPGNDSREDSASR